MINSGNYNSGSGDEYIKALSLERFGAGGDEIISFDQPGGVITANGGTINGATWYGSAGRIFVLGCTDPYAENYNENALEDYESCTYLENGDYSLSFDGVDDYVQLPEISTSLGAVNSSFPIISWFKKSNPDAGVFIHAGVENSSIICPRIESTSGK